MVQTLFKAIIISYTKSSIGEVNGYIMGVSGFTNLTSNYSPSTKREIVLAASKNKQNLEPLIMILWSVSCQRAWLFAIAEMTTLERHTSLGPLSHVAIIWGVSILSNPPVKGEVRRARRCSWLAIRHEGWERHLRGLVSLSKTIKCDLSSCTLLGQDRERG